MAELVEPQVSRYQDYKPTGVEWIPEIPVGWEVKKLKHCFKFAVGGTPTTSKASYFEGENTWVTIADMQQRVITESKTSLSDEALFAAGMEVVPKGSLLYSFKLSVGKVAFAGKDLHTNEAIFSVLPDAGYDLTYFYFALPELLIHSASQNIYGAKIFNQELLKNAFIALPPLEEQEAIVSFLDDKTAQLDQLITQKQQMLALLREERAALINHAVTKGLDPQAPLRDSGVEWLGKVPAHWEGMKMKHACSLLRDGTHQPPARVENGYPLLSVRNIVNGKFINLDDDSQISEADFIALENSFDVRKNDIVLAVVGATLGKVAIVEDMLPFTIQRSLAVFRPKPSLIAPRYMYCLFQSDGFQELLWSNVGFSAQPGIYLGALGNFNIVFPSIGEQEMIVEHIEAHSSRIAETTDTINQEIALLQEYRAALIAEAVTGQLDVRHYAPAAAAVLM